MIGNTETGTGRESGSGYCISSSNYNNNICVGVSSDSEDILFFQKKISYQHNMITKIFIHHIKLCNGKLLIGQHKINP